MYFLACSLVLGGESVQPLEEALWTWKLVVIWTQIQEQVYRGLSYMPHCWGKLRAVWGCATKFWKEERDQQGLRVENGVARGHRGLLPIPCLIPSVQISLIWLLSTLSECRRLLVETHPLRGHFPFHGYTGSALLVGGAIQPSNRGSSGPEGRSKFLNLLTGLHAKKHG
jgi:hypothetical protein